MDLMELEPYGPCGVRVGDVVAFLPPGKIVHVVHRVVHATPQGIRTLGDNNLYEDALDLRAEDLTGRVIAAWRGQKRRKVYGGMMGVLIARRIRITRRFDRAVSRVLRPAYHALARGGMLRALLPRSLRPRLVRFGTAGNSSMQLLWFGRAIGRYDSNLGAWYIRRPFKLFVDEDALPRTGVRSQVTGDS